MAVDSNKVKLNLLDRTVAWINPREGMRRLQARRSYEAAQYGRRNKSMKGATSNGPNVEIGVALQTLRNRSRSFANNGRLKNGGLQGGNHRSIPSTRFQSASCSGIYHSGNI